MDFFNNKNNDNIKFKINAEGIDTKDVEARLVFNTKDNLNYIIFGDIKEGVCTFTVPELKVYEKNNNGLLRFELVSKDLYFNVWEDKFNIKTKTTIKIDEMVRESVEEEKPQIKATLEATPIFEEKEEIEEKVVEKKKEKVVEKVEPKTEKTKEELLSFDSFFKKS